LRQSSKD